MAYILAADDDDEILLLIKNTLERDGHFVETVTSTKEITLKKAQFADLILLDVMMPEEDGFEYCKRIRHQIDSPIIFLTAKMEEKDLLHGLGLGADDYITKPFSIAELRARVTAHLRRENRPRNHTLRVGDVYLDLTAQKVIVENRTIALTKSEYGIAAFLLEHAGQVFSKEQIYECVLGNEKESEENVIVEHIKNIRAKLKAVDQAPIETVWGIGYRWKSENE